jgi:hypothetical protein
MTPAILLFVALQLLVILQTFLAYRDSFLSVTQMQQRGIGQDYHFYGISGCGATFS